MGSPGLILLDTHVLVWLDEASPRLGKAAIAKIDRAFHSGVTRFHFACKRKEPGRAY